MNRFFYALLLNFAVFFGAKAGQVDASVLTSEELPTFLCDPSDLTLGPIAVVQGNPPDCADYTFSVPPVSGCGGANLNGFYTFVVTDAIGTTIEFLSYTQSTSISTTLPSYGQYFVHIQYSYVDANGVGQSVTVATDFYYDGCVTTPCHPSSLSFGPISVAPGITASDCSDYTISVTPVSGCQWTTLNGYYSFEVFDDANNLIGSITNTQSTSFSVDLPYDDQYHVVVQYHYTDINGVTHTLTETTSFYYEGCDCKDIAPPTGIICIASSNPNGPHKIKWNAVPNAVSYEQETNFNDPRCCNNNEDRWTVVVPGLLYTTTYYYVNSCFSYRVRSVCEDGTKSEWSEYYCSCWTNTLVSGGSDPKSLKEPEDIQLHLETKPNPASTYVDVTLAGMSSDVLLDQSEMMICNLAGIEVYRSSISSNETKRVDLNEFKSGMYVISVVSNGSIVSMEKLVVK